MEQRQPLSVALPGGSEALLGGQFDSKSYVNGLRKLIPLEALCSSISSEIEKAYEALLCVINDRHQAVLKLASGEWFSTYIFDYTAEHCIVLKTCVSLLSVSPAFAMS